MAVVTRRLEEHDEVERFDCGDEPLNRYLKLHAWANQAKSSIGISYLAIDDVAPRAVLGHFTLAMASLPRDAFPEKHVRGLPPYELPLHHHRRVPGTSRLVRVIWFCAHRGWSAEWASENVPRPADRPCSARTVIVARRQYISRIFSGQSR